MNNYWAFARMTASNDLLDDPDALRGRLDRDGYLYFEQLNEPERVARVRTDMTRILADRGWIDPEQPEVARAIGMPVREGDEEYFETYDEIQRLESFHVLAHDERLLGVMREVVGETAFPHPLKVARLVFPADPAISTPPHQDYLNNQGTKNLTAVWVPLVDCPMEKGTLAVLRGSHRFGVLPLEFHLGPGNRQAVLPNDMLESLRWVTTDMRAGDALVFGALTVHAALNNATFEMRLSADFRYQAEGEALSDMVLEPHFGRLNWEQVYERWESDEFKYYWSDLDYEVVAHDKTPFEASQPKGEQIFEVLVYEELRRQRYESERRERSNAETN